MGVSNMKKRIIISSILAGVLALSLIGCGGTASNEGTKSDGAKQKHQTVEMIKL